MQRLDICKNLLWGGLFWLLISNGGVTLIQKNIFFKHTILQATRRTHAPSFLKLSRLHAEQKQTPPFTEVVTIMSAWLHTKIIIGISISKDKNTEIQKWICKLPYIEKAKEFWGFTISPFRRTVFPIICTTHRGAAPSPRTDPGQPGLVLAQSANIFGECL